MLLQSEIIKEWYGNIIKSEVTVLRITILITGLENIKPEKKYDYESTIPILIKMYINSHYNIKIARIHI